MKRIASIAFVLASLTPLAGQALADPNANNTKRFYDQLDRENRGGQGQ